LGTDKIADAVKELGIRLSEGGDEAKQAFSDVVGVSFDDVAAKVSAGEAQWSDYFDDIIGGLQDIEDPLERNRQQVALFGTQAEDLGVSFTEGLSAATTSLDDMTGSMDEIITKNASLGESMQTLNRQMIVALEPAAQELMPLLAEGVAKVSEFLTQARPIFTGFSDDLSRTLGPAIQIIGDSLARIGEIFGVVGEGASGMDVALAILEGTLGLVVTGIEAVAVASSLIATGFEIADFAVNTLVQTVKDLSSQLIEIVELLGNVTGVTEAFNIAGGLIGQTKQIGELLGFQEGGIVPGATGAPQLAIVHGGETILPPGQGGGALTININAPVFGVDDLDAKLNVWGQEIIDSVAGAMN
jgi:hypothetical protein